MPKAKSLKIKIYVVQDSIQAPPTSLSAGANRKLDRPRFYWM
jgi:hypothetical protein